MQPYFLPYISYFQLMKAVDVFVIYDDVNYINKGWINRNYISSGTNRQLFTLPLNKASQNKHINEIELFEFDKFKKNFLKSIELSYKKSPNYQTVMSLLHDILDYQNPGLSGFLTRSLEKLNAYMGIPTSLVASSSVYNNADLKAQERIIDICLKEKATNYINPIGGMELYSQEKFVNVGLDLKFIQTGALSYKQATAAYIPYLSIVDTLMFNSTSETNALLSNYTLIKN